MLNIFKILPIVLWSGFPFLCFIYIIYLSYCISVSVCLCLRDEVEKEPAFCLSHKSQYLSLDFKAPIRQVTVCAPTSQVQPPILNKTIKGYKLAMESRTKRNVFNVDILGKEKRSSHNPKSWSPEVRLLLEFK